jgi:hypothetical protein
MPSNLSEREKERERNRERKSEKYCAIVQLKTT